jgi:hypothetical protein
MELDMDMLDFIEQSKKKKSNVHEIEQYILTLRGLVKCPRSTMREIIYEELRKNNNNADEVIQHITIEKLNENINKIIQEKNKYNDAFIKVKEFLENNPEIEKYTEYLSIVDLTDKLICNNNLNADLTIKNFNIDIIKEMCGQTEKEYIY